MNKRKRLLSFAIIFCMVATIIPMMTSTVSAAEYCSSISGSTSATKTFKVKVVPKTYGSDYIKLSHTTKGKYGYYYYLGGYNTYNTKYRDSYGYYTVTVKDTSTGKTYKTLYWKNTKSLKIDLSRSWFKYKGSDFQAKTFTITVKPYSKSAMDKFLKKETIKKELYKWSKAAKWKVYYTRGVSKCW